TRFEYRHQNVVLARAFGGNGDDALSFEVICDAARVGERCTISAERRTNLGSGTVLVVGEALDHESDTARAVAFIHDRRVLDGVTRQSRTALDRAIDVIARNG